MELFGSPVTFESGNYMLAAPPGETSQGRTFVDLQAPRLNQISNESSSMSLASLMEGDGKHPPRKRQATRPEETERTRQRNLTASPTTTQGATLGREREVQTGMVRTVETAVSSSTVITSQRTSLSEQASCNREVLFQGIILMVVVC